jgi:hypothetical protein
VAEVIIDAASVSKSAASPVRSAGTRGAQLLRVEGEIQREAGATHLVERWLRDYSGLLGGW